jgi:pimeloyl-ACP methyl ester carboxylesterase
MWFKTASTPRTNPQAQVRGALPHSRRGLVFAFGYRTAAVVGRDAGSPVAAYCALIRPDVFRSVAMMTARFAGPPALPFNTVEGATQTAANPPEARTINNELAKLSRPRKHYQVYYTTREANDNMRNCPQVAYSVESGNSVPLFPTSGPPGERHRKPKASSAIFGGQGYDPCSAAFKSTARPIVAVT